MTTTSIQESPILLIVSVPELIPPILDSLYEAKKRASLVKVNEQFTAKNFEQERDRITEHYRNSGVYYFSQDYVRFNIDTTKLTKKVGVEVLIGDRQIRNEDSVSVVPFKQWRIKNVNIITDDAFENEGSAFNDSIAYEGL